MRWFLVLLMMVLPGISLAADTSIEVTDFYIYPSNSPDFNKLSGFTWPDVEELNAVLDITLAGYEKERKVTVFLVLFDEDEEVIEKLKMKYSLPVGSHSLEFDGLLRTDSILGSRDLVAKIEVSVKGARLERASREFTVSGPDPPDVDILDLEIYNPDGGRGDDWFEPGDEFVVEAIVEIENNETSIKPRIVVYAMMDEDMHSVDYDDEYQHYEQHWGAREIDQETGVVRIRVRGWLPYHFYYPWDIDHDFRVYIAVDFGSDAVTDDYIRAELRDLDAGDSRYAEKVEDRLIELDEPEHWRIERLRGERPDTGRDKFWD